MLFCGCLATMVISEIFFITSNKFWYYLLEPHSRYHRYYETHELSAKSILFGLLIQYFFITFSAYWMHRFFHVGFMYKHVHSVHHSFKEPSAFGY